ncbi:Uncharacterised protein [Salmonella enterica subsp. enterica serovar Bovismorbificans]|uniref:Uncharacterized protein n=1 Tax=Salmonella enterica subsp. enterica serovar Bovismorbificans TaxID=58097 RepID=A0A655C9D5_SALET|nr:Uncharacterised protein [Salmonella enterica subsp. enterica serovar Bovismorbificans]CNU99407.1 Uncharacterised protein [Salmonella enterica subsp. enterica serovar Bovismorbificans]
MLTQLSAEILEIDATVYTANIQKHLVNGVLLNAWRQLFQVNHDPVRH